VGETTPLEGVGEAIPQAGVGEETTKHLLKGKVF